MGEAICGMDRAATRNTHAMTEFENADLRGAQFRDVDRPTQSADATTSSIPLSELPPQGQRTYRAIFQGGPFEHDKDGTVFGNRERLLPSQRRGHYREYTVDTPGASNRGARRIVCGGERKTAPLLCWYTADHYASFRRIVP